MRAMAFARAFGAVTLVAAIAGCGPKAWTPHADGFESVRRAMIDRPRRVIYNTDGNDMMLYPTNLPITAEAFESIRLKHTEGTRIDSVFYCPQSSGFCYLTTRKAGEFLSADYRPAASPVRNAAADFAASGTDALEMASAYCRRRGLEIFVSLRMNDTHDNGGMQKPGAIDPHFPPFKRNHPDWLMGSVTNRPRLCAWTAVDYAHEGVRAHLRKTVADLVSNYDVDGVEYDFFRHLQLFRTVANLNDATADELGVMNALMRELRTVTENAGRKRGKPFLVAVRVPDSVGMCRAVGIDLESWMREDLVDLVIGSSYFQLNRWRTTADLVHAAGKRFYASLDESRNQRKRAPLGLLPGRGKSVPFYRARAAAAVESGADGYYLFNIEGQDLGRLASIDAKSVSGKWINFAVPRATALAQLRHYCRDPYRFYRLPAIEPQQPHRLPSGGSYSFTMEIGTEPCAAIVRLLTDLGTMAEVKVSVNGVGLERIGFDKGVFAYAVPASVLRRGDNAIGVFAPVDCRLADFSLESRE